jgi:antitoxin (DNA-binding transcriptional repressor) of toxin-antitoxin stability system
MAAPTARTESPMVRAGSGDALVYTVQDLNQQAARIMSQVEKAREPAFITRNGRFIAIIRPLAPGQIESRVLAEISREVSKRAEATAAQEHAPRRFRPATAVNMPDPGPASPRPR